MQRKPMQAWAEYCARAKIAKVVQMCKPKAG